MAMNCAFCKTKACYTGKDCSTVKPAAEAAYTGEKFISMRASTAIEARHYMKKNRLEELITYASMMGYERLGIAFCIGLSEEAEKLHLLLAKKFEVYSVCCKVCGIDKSVFELERLHSDEEEGFEVEAMCNPIGQAMVLNNEKTDLNIIVGLCIGHDILFTQHSDAPVTTFVVKDRVLAHNPIGAVYSGYHYKRITRALDTE